MRKTMRLAALLLLALSLFVVPAQSGLAQSNSRTFPQTGKTVSGQFLTYWNNHGGLAQQGYPISDEVQAVSPSDGNVYTVQYFERAIFENHPENTAPNDVELSLLGDFAYKQKYPTGAPNQTPNKTANAAYFSQTGKTLGGEFLAYWNNHGGLAQQGYPISDEFQEKSDLDGKTYTVQYFERAVFEYHPENQAPNDVLLSQLGKFREQLLNNPGSRVLDTLEEVWWAVENDYVYPDYRGLNWPAIHDEYEAKIAATTTDDAAYTLVSEMVDKLNDRHSSFENPTQRTEDDALRNGDLKISGIGVTMGKVGDMQRITYVIPGSPAEKAGLRVFDVILAVNGVKLTDDPNAYVNVRGTAGTPVTLTIQSPGEDPRDVTIVRQTVEFSYHASAIRLPGTNVAYVDIPTYNAFGIASETAAKIQALAKTGPLDGAIINMRLNSGGLIDEMLHTVGLFIDGGIAGYSATRTTTTPDRIPSGQTVAALQGKPIVILISNICESACEHFSVAMHDLNRATLIGTTTAGNTETLYPHDTLDGGRLFLASETFLRPDKTSIEDKGLPPDQTLDVPWYTYQLSDDPQVKAALQVIAAK